MFCLFIFDEVVVFDIVIVLVGLGIRSLLCDCAKEPDLVSLISECGQDAKIL